MSKDISIYDEEKVEDDSTLEPVSVSSANRVITLLKKRDVVILALPGEFTWAPPINPNTYSDDTELHSWVRDAIDNGCIILRIVDGKLPYLEKVAEILHFHVFLVEGVLGHEMSGVAKSITAHLDTVNQLDVEHIAAFISADGIAASLKMEDEDDDILRDLKTLDEGE